MWVYVMSNAGFIKRLAAAMTLLCLLSSFAAAVLALPADGFIPNYALPETGDTYNGYIGLYKEEKFATDSILLNAGSSNSVSSEVEGKVCNLLDEKNSSVEYNFEVRETGLYNITVTYYDLLGGDNSIDLGFYFDGAVPYTELESVTFSKIYQNELETLETDEFGNQIRPSQVAKQRFNTETIESETGVSSLPYSVYLTAGAHSLTVKRVLGSIVISEILIGAAEKAVPYEEYISQYSLSDINGDEKYVIEAENTFEVNSSTLGATIDSTNAGMSPASSTERVVNGFGKDYWNSNGQWGSWRVPDSLEEGLYKISFRAKQTGAVGVTSYRRLYVNGKIPFAEAENIAFEYNSKWQIKTFGDSDAYYLYLKPGDVITLEATTGEMADIINSIYTVMDRLNEIYQSIIIITGTSPDPNRDYNIQAEIPTLLGDFDAMSGEISEIADAIEAIMKKPNTKVYSLRSFAAELKSYVDNYRIIVDELGSFKNHIDSLAAQTYDFNNLPLELDWIELSKKDAEKPAANVGAFRAFAFEIQKFLYTFTSEYRMTPQTDTGLGEISVWCGLGRDQAQAVKSLIDNEFIPQTGISVNFRMTTAALAEAILAGREPDVSLSVTQDVPVDLALRGEALNLSPYLESLPEEYMSQFNESAWLPFRYDGGTYAVPITQDYYMMFYRRDILAKAGVKVPETWSELYDAIRELQKSNLKVGIRESDSANAGISMAINVFDMFLYQNGGRYFNDSLTATEFESPAGKSAFKQWVSLYRDYGLDSDFNPLTRFRSGEMPIILTGYSFYMTLEATAREISGRWDMALMPGTLSSDGKVDRTETSVVTGTMILKGAKRRGVADQAFEFVKWWAGHDMQLKYINAMESIQGIAGRLATANLKTFEELGWTQSEKAVLKEQRRWVTAVNQVPGMYIINRSLTNALRASYESSAVDPLRQLNIQNSVINGEISRKRLEFEKNN